MTDGLVWDSHPELRNPILVAAFEGWSDAGDAATGAIDWLVDQGQGRRFAWIDPDEHIDYQARRPTWELSAGVAASVTWPANDCYVVRFPERDLVVLRGVEPNIRWRSFCAAVLRVAHETGCELVVTLGALLGDVPHTRPVRVTGASSDPVLAQLLGIVPSRYEGPTGIVGVLHDTCSVVGIRSLSLWAPVPHYVARQTSPAGSRALLERLALVTGVRLDLGPLDQLEQDWRAAVDVIVSDDDDTERYVRELEQRVDDEPEPRHPSLGGISIPDGDELAAELERYLRDETDPDDP